MIAAVTDAAAFAAKAATPTIPIVFLVSDDPVRMGLVSSLARPDGNLTGVSFLAAELSAKRMEFLRQLVHGATRVAVLVDPTVPAATESTLRDVGTAARAMGLQIEAHNAATSREIEAAFASFVRETPDALFVGSSPFFTDRRVQFALLAVLPSCRRHIRGGFRGSGRTDELRSKPARCNTSGWCLCHPHPQGRETRRPAGPAVEQVDSSSTCKQLGRSNLRCPTRCYCSPTR